jgi:hypothetical protein
MRLNIILINRAPWSSHYQWEFRLLPCIGLFVVNTSTKIWSLYFKWLFWDFQIRLIKSENHGKAHIHSGKKQRRHRHLI